MPLRFQNFAKEFCVSRCSRMVGMLIVLLLRLDVSICQELSLRLIIEKRSELTTLAKDVMLQNTDVMVYLGNTALMNTVFFAPSNEAFTNLLPAVRLQLTGLSKEAVNRIFQYHLVPGVSSSSPFNPFILLEGQQIRASTLFGTTFLYASKIDGNVYINGARIVIPNLTATNGVVHIIDRVLIGDGATPMGLWGSNGYGYITDSTWVVSSVFRNFEDYQLRGTIQESGNYKQLTESVLRNPAAYCTIFVPSNDFITRFSQLNQDLYSKINSQSPALMKQVVESLIIPHKAYHISLLERLTSVGRPVDAVRGQIRVYTMNGMTYVSNRCGQARVLVEDATTSNCVVHVVDNFLGLVTTDIFNETFKHTDLQEFRRSLILSSNSPLVINLKAKGGQEYLVPENEKFTLFAPTNDVFQYVDFSRNEQERLQQLSMVISPGLVDLSLLGDGSKISVDTMRTGYKATITRVKQSYYVEVNHVKALVVQGNICTTNGYIHKVDRIVGTPDGSIGDYLGRRVGLRRLEVIMQETGLLTVCNNPTVQVTLFAPNESAVMTLDPLFQGQQNKKKLTKLMYTHVSDDALFLDNLADGSSVDISTYNGVVSVSRSGQEFWVSLGDTRVKIIQGNIGASNGVIHIIERFLPYVYNGLERGCDLSKLLWPSMLFVTLYSHHHCAS